MSKNKNKQKNNGFIALMSAIIISAILLGLLVTSSGNGLSTRIDELNRELKRESEGLAQSCAESALLAIAENYSYTPNIGGDVVAVDDNSCTVDSVTYGAEDVVTHVKTATIQTHAEFRQTWTTLRVTASVASSAVAHNPPIPPVSVTSWQEI